MEVNGNTDRPDKHGVVAIIRDREGRFLFIQRGLKLARAPGVWCFVGGEVEDDEPFNVAIEREVREEVGLRVRALDEVFESVSPNNEFLLHWYRVEVLDDPPELSPSPLEVETYRWLSREEGAGLDPILPTLREWLHSAQL